VVTLKQQAPDDLREKPILASHAAGSQLSYKGSDALPEIKNLGSQLALGRSRIDPADKFGQGLSPHMNKNLTVI